MRAKIFTLDEANNLIPQLTQIFEKMKHVKTKIELIKESLDLSSQKEEFQEHPEKLVERISIFTEELKKHIAEVQSYGCLVKDLENFLVDFYSVKDNKLIFLCWKHGETQISYWHETETGFKGRLPLSPVKEEAK